MPRKIFLIDGFNLYHSICANPVLVKYKWLNLRKLCECFKLGQNVEAIYYFTALTKWKPQQMARHQLFISVLEDLGIKIIYGQFRAKTKYCDNCQTTRPSHEEKQTDVNIAIELLQLAYENKFDTASIISGDSDLIPAIKKVNDLFGEKKIDLVIPYNRSAEELKGVCNRSSKIKIKHLHHSLLPYPQYTLKDNITQIQCPPTWV